MSENPDVRARRCPRLGHDVTFAYCRDHGGDTAMPCFKIFDCWWEIFDVVDTLRRQLAPETFERLAEYRPRPKVSSLVDLIEQAKRRTGEND